MTPEARVEAPGAEPPEESAELVLAVGLVVLCALLLAVTLWVLL